MKGQSLDLNLLITAVVASALIGVGIIIFAYVADQTPHDESIVNETVCTTCTSGSTNVLDNVPALNDSTLICHNLSGTTAALMTNGGNIESLCLSYTLIDGTYINLTNSSTECDLGNVMCSYTYDRATDNENNYWNSAMRNTSSGFTLTAIMIIVLAAVFVILIIMALTKLA